jgi:hypothetical protein
MKCERVSVEKDDTKAEPAANPQPFVPSAENRAAVAVLQRDRGQRRLIPSARELEQWRYDAELHPATRITSARLLAAIDEIERLKAAYVPRPVAYVGGAELGPSYDASGQVLVTEHHHRAARK